MKRFGMVFWWWFEKFYVLSWLCLHYAMIVRFATLQILKWLFRLSEPDLERLGERSDAALFQRAKQVGFEPEEPSEVADDCRGSTADSSAAAELPEIGWWVFGLVSKVKSCDFRGFTDESSFPMNDSKNELKRLRAMSKASKQAELKR